MILAGLRSVPPRRDAGLHLNIPPDLYKDGCSGSDLFRPSSCRGAYGCGPLDGGIDYRLRQLSRRPPTWTPTCPAGTPGAAIRGPGRRQRPGPRRCRWKIGRSRRAGRGNGLVRVQGHCEGPRSQNDYIEIARLYHTVFISNIPEFRSGDDNAARRFIMLIDEFYDRNVNIVVSAAAARALYHGETLRTGIPRLEQAHRNADSKPTWPVNTVPESPRPGIIRACAMSPNSKSIPADPRSARQPAGRGAARLRHGCSRLKRMYRHAPGAHFRCEMREPAAHRPVGTYPHVWDTATHVGVGAAMCRRCWRCTAKSARSCGAA